MRRCGHLGAICELARTWGYHSRPTGFAPTRARGRLGAGGDPAAAAAGASPTVFNAIAAKPERLLVTTFGALILAGAALLHLPAAATSERINWVDALFTSTSAVCVTGLTTVDTERAFSHFGHWTILLLIQMGGLGIMTFTALLAHVFRVRTPFSAQQAFEGSFFETEDRQELRRSVISILLLTFMIEAVGAACLLAAMRLDGGMRGGVFEASFHAVSAFCNAGFSVYSENAVAMRASPLAMGTIAALIVLGGLGYTVLLEGLNRIGRRLRRKPPSPLKWSLQTRVVLRASGMLIVAGAALLALCGLTPIELTWFEYGMHAVFQSVSARTAGFNTIDIGALPMASLLVLIALMFIGGSPGSCAGGIKTTSAAVWVARMRARLRSRDDVIIADRRVPRDIVRRSALLLSVALAFNAAGVFVLSITEAGSSIERLEHLMFEQISAFGTVGLSANVTPELSTAGKLWIALTMFVGRVGPLTLAVSVLHSVRPRYQLPEERIMIG